MSINIPNEETISFEFFFQADYWDKPPMVNITVDDVEKYYGEITKEKNYIKFFHTCSFDKEHNLCLERYNKSDDQVKVLDNEKLDQILKLEKLIIDGVNVRNIVYSYSVTNHHYPEVWAAEQQANGHFLDQNVVGNTIFAHNCTWNLNFTSPFYRFIMRWMGGGV